MGKASTQPTREQILRRLYSLSGVKANDAVLLAFLDEEKTGIIPELELKALREFKRGASGGTEIKLIDRAHILEVLLEHLDNEHKNTGAGFFKALEQLAREDDQDLGDQ
ncbi:MAG: XRE family transcriptional regulator [Oscillospiraceae bacterium]|nr:XRE family transcriptional regulator [Oscillospiraceae bacterium]